MKKISIMAFAATMGFFTSCATKNADGVFMGSMGGSIKSTMTWEGKTLTITDLDPDTGLPADAIVFVR